MYTPFKGKGKGKGKGDGKKGSFNKGKPNFEPQKGFQKGNHGKEWAVTSGTSTIPEQEMATIQTDEQEWDQSWSQEPSWDTSWWTQTHVSEQPSENCWIAEEVKGEGAPEDKEIICETCNMTIWKSQFNDHMSGLKHKKNVQGQWSQPRVSEHPSENSWMVQATNPEQALTTDHQSSRVDLNKNPTYVVLDLGCTRSMGSRKAVEAFAQESKAYGITMEYRPCDTTFVFADSQMGKVTETCIVHFPTTPPCTTQIDILEKGSVPILLSLPQMKNLGMGLKLSAQGDRITCPAFGLYDATPEISTAGHIVLNMASIQNRPRGPTKTATRGVTFTAEPLEEAFPVEPGACKACQGSHRNIPVKKG